MTISELIIDLQELLRQDGDLEGVKYGSDGWVYIPTKQFDELSDEQYERVCGADSDPD
jgi:hypothetical protein